MIKIISTFCKLKPRERLDYDIVIVGAGPAGLAAAIRLKQLQVEYSREINVCLLEKGPAVGSHILSGNCFEPRALDQLLPNWRSQQNPLQTKVSKDTFYFLTKKSSYKMPQFLLPSTIHNKNNYLISLGRLTQWLAQKAQSMGVQIFPSTSVQGYIQQDNRIVGIYTKDTGVGKDGTFKQTYSRGMQIRGKQTILAQGCRGSVSQQIIQKYDLRKNSDPQIYGIGLKQVWQVPQQNFKQGLVQHTVGWPLPSNVYSGSFIYHMKINKSLQIHLGLVVGLDYKDPYLNPYDQLQVVTYYQRIKTHPLIQRQLVGGQCVSYGARALNQGGYFSIPRVVFPGGVLVGCSAGLLNVMKIKGTHNAMKSGMIAAQQIFNHIINNLKQSQAKSYEVKLKESWVYEQLYKTRNFKNSFYNLYSGLVYGGMLGLVFRGREFWNIRNYKKDCDAVTDKINYNPRPALPKSKLIFPILENLSRSGTNHQHNQPSHLQIKENSQKAIKQSYEMGAPQTRFCPAKVYQFVQGKLVINAQNCLHCKTCDIKTHKQYINWNVPQGGGGPKYNNM